MKFDAGDFNINMNPLQGINQNLYKSPLEDPKIQRQLNETFERRKKAEESQIEMNETTKQMNEQLQSINHHLQSKLDKIYDNIDFVINTIGANAQTSEEQRQEQTEILIELRTILELRDEKGFKSFLEKHTGDMIALVGLILQVLPK